MSQSNRENLVYLGLDNNPRSGKLGTAPFTVLHYAKTKRAKKIMAEFWEESSFMMCIPDDLPSHSFKPTNLLLKTHATTADTIFLFELRKARERWKEHGLEALTDEERDLLKHDIRAAEDEAKVHHCSDRHLFDICWMMFSLHVGLTAVT